jgi:tetratricopeptide (TPR) repeat protein
VEEAIETEAASLLEEDFVGQRLGPYRVLKEIGRGGMGAVFLAERSDDEFHKLVAIKVVKRGMDTEELLGRFRRERQILAALEHANIARLIDGGSTPDGRPFFVMERVEGYAIDVHCRERERDTHSILRLLLRVCEAVSYAHRALVVHRDLKPGNILVNAEGVPKLLDFGVAKLLGPEGEAGLTSTSYGGGPLTPEYASPEQVRGLPVTTATDVYALGAILFELLTGVQAQKIPTKTPQEIERIVCDTQPPPPSALARAAGKRRRLSRDLDNIVAMAMRKEAERRYSSVEQFAGDIARHLEGLPVMARRDSPAYRASRFIRRNRWPLAAGALIFGSLVAGVAVSTQQASEAETARRAADTQRQAAERERSRAEQEALAARAERDRAARRLMQMMELANRSLYDVHSAIEKLPGAVEARRQIVATTLQFLENLAKDVGHDDRLRFVLSTAYAKVADVQGYPLRPNLGDPGGALVNYARSVALLKPLLAKEPDKPEYLLQQVEVETNRSIVLGRMSKAAEARRILGEVSSAARKLARIYPHDARCLLAEAAVYSALEEINIESSLHQLEYAHQQTQVLERALRSFPEDIEIQTRLAAAWSEEAKASNRRGRLRESLKYYRRSITLRERLLERNPADVLMRRSLMIGYGNMGGALGSPFYANVGDTAGAQEAYGKALEIARELAAADTHDRLAQSDLAHALLFYASLDWRDTELSRSLVLLREAEGVAQSLLAGDPQSQANVMLMAMIQEYEGRRLRVMGNPAASVTAIPG